MLPIILSCASLVVSAVSLWYARKGYLLNDSKERRQTSNFTLYVICSADFNKESTQVVQLSCNITNDSDMQNSLMWIELRATYDKGSAKISVRHQFDLVRPNVAESADQMFPLNFAPRESKKLNLQALISVVTRPSTARLRDTSVMIRSGDGLETCQAIELLSEKSIF